MADMSTPDGIRLDDGVEVSRTPDMRRNNLATVLAVIDKEGSASQADLVTRTGMASAAVSTLVAQLLSWGVLEESASAPTRQRGRPRRLLSVRPGSAVAVGVDIGADEISILLTDSTGTQLTRHVERHTSTDTGVDEMGRLVGSMVDRVAPEGLLASRAVSIAIAIPGPVSGGLTTSLARGWFRSPLSGLLRWAPAGSTAQVVNDGDAAVVAEHTMGRASGQRDIAVLHGSGGLAGGIVTGGRLVLGHEGVASSIGHIPVVADGLRCPCGSRGCAARYVSVAALAARLGRSSDLERASLREFAAVLAERAAAGDARLLAALGDARAKISLITHVVGTVVSPQTIVLTGNLAPLGPWLEILDVPDRLGGGARINWGSPVITSGFGTDSAVIGAAETARRTLLADPERMAWTGPAGGRSS